MSEQRQVTENLARLQRQREAALQRARDLADEERRVHEAHHGTPQRYGDDPVSEPEPSPDAAALAAENEQLRQRLEHEQRMRVEAARPKWIAEAKKHAPFCLRPEEIQAVSRRDFLWQAKADHEANRPLFEKVIAQEREKLLEQTAEIRAEEKRKLREAWEGTSSVPEPEEYAVPPVDLERLEERRPRAQADFTEALAAHVKEDPGLLEHVFGR